MKRLDCLEHFHSTTLFSLAACPKDTNSQWCVSSSRLCGTMQQTLIYLPCHQAAKYFFQMHYWQIQQIIVAYPGLGCCFFINSVSFNFWSWVSALVLATRATKSKWVQIADKTTDKMTYSRRLKRQHVCLCGLWLNLPVTPGISDVLLCIYGMTC